MSYKNKILHIANWLGMGGAEKLLVETLPRYRKAGFDVELLLTTDITTPLRTELEKHVKIHTLPHSSFYDIRSIFRIIPFIKKYDLVHVHLFPPQYYVAIAKLLSRSKTPLVFTEHSTSNTRMKSKIFILPDKFVYAQYTKICCITDQVKKILEQRINISQERLVVIENGVDLEKIGLAKKNERKNINTGLTDDDVLLLQVSSFQEPKDQITVIKSLLHLPENIKLLLAGDGVLRKECESLTSELNLQHRVFFLGLRNDIPQLLKTVDLVLLSSKYEGLSLSSVEGMACGKPFIASDVPGLTEVVGGAGVLFPAGDDIKLSMEILKLIDNKDYYNTIAEKCELRSRQYDINIMVDKHITLYNKLLKNIT